MLAGESRNEAVLCERFPDPVPKEMSTMVLSVVAPLTNRHPMPVAAVLEKVFCEYTTKISDDVDCGVIVAVKFVSIHVLLVLATVPVAEPCTTCKIRNAPLRASISPAVNTCPGLKSAGSGVGVAIVKILTCY